jgi:predicted nucleic acid-binding protein
MPGFVADASVAVAWVHPSQGTADSTVWLGQVAAGSRIFVPVLWTLEIGNALLVLERRGRLTSAERHKALRFLRELPVETDSDAARLGLGALSDLATEHALSVYDAAYLELALRRQLPLACKDGPLQQAAQRAGIRIVP